MLRALALCLSLALAACVAAPQPPGAAAPGAPPPHIAILVPLSGPHSEVGPALVNGARLALDGPGAPILDVFDTHGTPGGSAEAARQAVAAGDAVMLGPLTASDTAAAAPIALSAGIPVLAFTNDTTQSHPGVWTMGITPGQQVRRLVQILRDRGRTRIAGLLPHSDFGRAMEQGLTESAAEFGLPPPSVREYAPLPSSIGDALNELESHTAPTIASFGSPPPSPLPPPPPLSSGPETPPAQAAAPAPPPLPAAFPFDALLLADTGGGLALVAAQLSKTGVHQPDVQIVGPALWASTNSGGSRVAGAWYAAADPGMRTGYEGAYQQRYGTLPPAISDLAYDAAAIARAAAVGGPRAITAQPFRGADGPLHLLPDGHVRRGLAVFEVQRSGPGVLIEPPLSAPGT